MEEVSTLFVVGFPDDFKEREFVNLFAFAAGFEGASLKYPDCFATEEGGWSRPVRQIIGFARFQSRQEAIAARDHLNGKCIDQDRGAVLKVEMAKKNLFIPNKHKALAAQPATVATGAVFHPHLHPIHQVGMPFGPLFNNPSSQLPPRTASITRSESPTPSLDPPMQSLDFDRTVRSTKFLATSPTVTSATFLPGENPPCNTLYVGNLPVQATEEELLALFQPYPGFRRLSFKLKPNGPMCFVEFADVACATLAMDSLYGALLSCSHKGGIRLSYSKNPLGVKPLPSTSTTTTITNEVTNNSTHPDYHHIGNMHLNPSLYNGAFNLFG